MKITGIIKKQNNFYYIRCNEGQFPITLSNYIRCDRRLFLILSNVPVSMLEAAINLTATATIDFNRPCHREEFDFWLKDDLEIIHPLLRYYELQKSDN